MPGISSREFPAYSANRCFPGFFGGNHESETVLWFTECVCQESYYLFLLSWQGSSMPIKAVRLTGMRECRCSQHRGAVMAKPLLVPFLPGLQLFKKNSNSSRGAGMVNPPIYASSWKLSQTSGRNASPIWFPDSTPLCIYLISCIFFFILVFFSAAINFDNEKEEWLRFHCIPVGLVRGCVLNRCHQCLLIYSVSKR